MLINVVKLSLTITGFGLKLEYTGQMYLICIWPRGIIQCMPLDDTGLTVMWGWNRDVEMTSGILAFPSNNSENAQDLHIV